jgi:molybdopterin-guanine dinucleotide biosynthesis protein A
MLGAILAGGASTRFGGAPKGLQRVGGARIIDRVADALRGATDALILISNAPDADRWLEAVPAFADARVERGSVVGLHTALTHASDYVLVAAWDMPFVTPSLFALIAERAARSPYAVVPESTRGLEPLCAAYSTRCLPSIEAMIDAGEFRLSAVLDQLPSFERVAAADVATIGDPSRLFLNVNSPSELALAEQLVSNL